MYPYIILDEFQDTNASQWRVMQALGKHSVLLALADPEQRIYDCFGADPERLNHFKSAFSPAEVDLSTDNHRSAGTEIVAFGNDILEGKFRKKSYLGVECIGFPANDSAAYSRLVTTTYAARSRLIDAGRKGWSLAVLVPTKKMTRLVSDAFRSPPAGMKAIPHTAVIEMEAVILAAEIVAFLMQPGTNGRHFDQFISLLSNYFHGKGGDAPTKTDLLEADNILKNYDEWLAKLATGKPIRRNSILVNILSGYAVTRKLVLNGIPDADWSMVRQTLEDGPCPRLKGIADEVRNLRLLGRGTQLRQELSQDWRDNGAYANALAITRQAFVREHFSTNLKPETGVVVMNMHKAKGKQFDEVIVFEGWPRKANKKIVANYDRIVRGNLLENADNQARQNFRVSVTRGKLRATVLTPATDPCIILVQ
jgi:DNA helicase-2/ATP-dependent DNA helicase PcrA